MAGVSKALVHKAQGGVEYLIKGPSLIKLLRGLGLDSQSPEWQRAIALWSSERMASGEKDSPLRQRLVARLSGMSAQQLREIQEWLDQKHRDRERRGR